MQLSFSAVAGMTLLSLFALNWGEFALTIFLIVLFSPAIPVSANGSFLTAGCQASDATPSPAV